MKPYEVDRRIDTVLFIHRILLLLIRAQWRFIMHYFAEKYGRGMNFRRGDFIKVTDLWIHKFGHLYKLEFMKSQRL